MAEETCFLNYGESLNKIQFSFLVSRQVIEIKLKSYTERDSTHVHCIYDIESRSF